MSGAAEQHRLAHRTDEFDAPAAHGERADERVRLVDRVDARVDDDEIRRGLCSALRGHNAGERNAERNS